MTKIDKLYNLLNLLLIVMAELNAIPMEVAPIAVAEAVAEAVATPSEYSTRETLREKVARMLEAREQARPTWEAQRKASLEAQKAQQLAEAERYLERMRQQEIVAQRLNQTYAPDAPQSRPTEIHAEILMDLARVGTLEKFREAFAKFELRPCPEHRSLFTGSYHRSADSWKGIPIDKCSFGEYSDRTVLSVALDNNRFDILEYILSTYVIHKDNYWDIAYKRGRINDTEYPQVYALFKNAPEAPLWVHMSY